MNSQDLAEITREYVETGEPLHWPIPPELASSVGIVGRNASAGKIAGLPIKVGARLNGCLAPDEMRQLLRVVSRYLLPHPLQGVGLELGGGLGVLSSMVAACEEVETVFCVDVCENFAKLVIPRVAKEVLGEKLHKVIPVVGSFDDIGLPDASVDFVVEIGSLHHSDDLGRTVLECARVLKPGGRLICFDRVQPDCMSDEEVEERLSKTYSQEWLVVNGYPENITLTRGENGEHEYRRFEWLAAFNVAGLRIEKSLTLRNRVSMRMALKGLCSILPFSLQRRWFRRPLPMSWFLAWIVQKLRLPIGKIGQCVFAPCDREAMLLSKQ